jgi:hypothetical protein
VEIAVVVKKEDWRDTGKKALLCPVGFHVHGKVVRVFVNISGFCNVTVKLKVGVYYGFCFMVADSVFGPVGMFDCS